MGSSLNLKGGTSTPKSIVESFSGSNTFVPGDAVRYDVATSAWVKAQADSAENSEVAGVISSSTSSTFDITYSGYISVSALAGISAPVLFLDWSTAGGLTSSPPSSIGSVVKPVLTKTTNGTGYVVTNYLGTQIGGSSTVAIDEIQPVGTIMPFAGSVIPDSWLECNGASYAIGTYPNLYAKLQNSSGDRVPGYGYVVTLGTNSSGWQTTNQFVSQSGITAEVIAVNGSTITARVIPNYSTTNKNFVFPNVAFTASAATATVNNVNSSVIITTVAITHFNTPDLRGRFAVGANTSTLPTTGDLESDTANNSAISGIYSLGSEGGQESTVVDTAGVLTGTGNSKYTTTSSSVTGLLSNMPPYTVVRYIIKATPYTRAAIIDGIDIPYNSLLVGDLRDGSLRPGGSGEDLLFKTNDGTSGVERMRLTNAGNLGIGTTTPQYKFVVSNSGAEGFEFIPANTSGVNIIQSYNRSGGVFNTIDFRASDYKVRVGNTELLTINSSGQVNIAATTESTSTTIGGLTLGGGLGIAKNLTVGGGISAAGGITFSGLIRLTNTTPATSTTIGALTVAGGLGVAGALYVGGITTAGGVTMGGALTVGGAAKINSSTPSTTTTSGALTVAGGVGIAGALHVGGGISADGITLGLARLAVPSGNAPIFGARAWAVANWSGSAISLGNAGNIGSVVYNTGGDRSVTFTFPTNTPMPTADYVVVATAQRIQGANSFDSSVTTVTSRTTTSFTVGVEARSGVNVWDTSGNRITSLQVAVFC